MRWLVKTSIALAAVLIASFTFACKEQSTTMLNKEATIYFGDSQIEATARELTVDGGRTAVRVRFVNISGSPLESLDASVDFVDIDGNVIASDEITLTFEEPLAVGDGVSATARCNSDDRIVSVALSSVDSAG